LSNKAAGLAIFALALLPRLLAPGDFLTVDEAYHWFERAEHFAQALLAGRFAETNLIGHPGVTTMWLGALGWLLHSALSSAGHIAPDASAPFYELLRMPLAVANALCVALAFPLLRRLFGLRVAWLAVLLWASEPFIIAHSGIVHVDALLASFMTLSLLTALLAFGADSAPAAPLRWPWLALSGVAGGLALLTKSPAVLLLPVIAGYGLWAIGQGSGVRGQGLGVRGQSPSPITHHPSPITHHPSPITHHPSPITHHPSPITHHPSPLTSYPCSPGAPSPRQCGCCCGPRPGSIWRARWSAWCCRWPTKAPRRMAGAISF
jgi:hypothetical protein